jgi:hypothetical protein
MGPTPLKFVEPVYAFTSEQRVRISTLMVTPTHVGVSGGEPLPLVDRMEVRGDRAGNHASHHFASGSLAKAAYT